MWHEEWLHSRPALTARTLVLVLLSGCGPAPLRSTQPTSPGASAPAVALDRAARVAATLVPVVRIKGIPPVRHAIEQRMKHFHVPSVSVAVADHGQLAWARAFGASPKTLFQAASISKTVTATATLRLVEQGKLSLDEDVNAYLRSWKVPDNEFTATEKVTLRRILSHSAGLSGHTVCNYGESPGVPTLPQVLDGKWPQTEAVRVEAVPGSVERYSGGGVTIEQLVLSDVTQRPFPELLDELVLGPANMMDSTFAQPLPPEMEARAAQGYNSTGEAMPTHGCPEVAAAGLWTTPSDLVKWAIEITAARDGRSSRLLSKRLSTEMLTAQQVKRHFGLGPFLEGEGRAFHFGHEGWNPGFHAEVVYFPHGGQGAAVMINGDAGRPMVREILYAIAAEYGWPDFAPATIEALPMDARILDRVVGSYQSKFPSVAVTVTRDGARLFLDAPLLGAKTEMVFTSTTRLVTLDAGDEFSITTSDDGQVTALNFGYLKVPRRTADPTP
jgi:CubicO group peptidase (beta-lactamase class C family)